jgi:hypothetical protein
MWLRCPLGHPNMPRGGHFFACLEQPELFVREIRTFFARALPGLSTKKDTQKSAKSATAVNKSPRDSRTRNDPR